VIHETARVPPSLNDRVPAAGINLGRRHAAASGLLRCDPLPVKLDATAIDQPPAAMQGVGTAAVAGHPGTVLVVAAPDELTGKWLRLRRPDADSGFPEFQGILSQVRGEGGSNIHSLDRAPRFRATKVSATPPKLGA
jgi:hypothetical protein